MGTHHCEWGCVWRERAGLCRRGDLGQFGRGLGGNGVRCYGVGYNDGMGWDVEGTTEVREWDSVPL